MINIIVRGTPLDFLVGIQKFFEKETKNSLTMRMKNSSRLSLRKFFLLLKFFGKKSPS